MIRNPETIEVRDEGATQGRIRVLDFVGAGVTATVSGQTGTITVSGSGGAGGITYTVFTKDLGTARRSGTFDITGLSGLTANKVVNLVQTAGAIASRGNAQDEPEMDLIRLTGYVVDAATIRVYWNATGVVVGTYEFAYVVSG